MVAFVHILHEGDKSDVSFLKLICLIEIQLTYPKIHYVKYTIHWF